jgi:hypothetical protein
MRGYELVTTVFVTVLTLCTFGCLSPRAIAQEPSKPPTFGCEAGPGQECSYVTGDERGNLNFVVAYHQTHVMNADTVGMKYCVNFGPPKQAVPSWPKCLKLVNGAGHTRGTIKAGYNE